MNTKILIILLVAWMMTMATKATPLDDKMRVPVNSKPNRESRSVEPESQVPWHLDRIDQRKLPLDDKYEPSGRGSGVDIYIFAEGIQYDHHAFGGRASNGGFKPDKGCSQIGTELASLAAGRFVGVANRARIYSINVLACNLYTSVTTVIQALNFVMNIASTTGRRSVIVLPLEGRNSKRFNYVVKKVVDNNIVVVTAASYHDACRYSPGNSPHVINVGATQRKDRLYQLSRRHGGGSNFGKCVSLYAPGDSVLAARDDDYGAISGTHAACGIVGGAAALVLEKFPHYSPAQVKRHLIKEGTADVVRTPIASASRLLYVGNGEDYDESSASGEMIQPIVSLGNNNNKPSTDEEAIKA